MQTFKVAIASIQRGPHQHQSFGEEYRPLFERMIRVFADVFPGSAQEWEDDFRRDLNPEREMDIWSKIADCYEHFTDGRDMDLARKKEIFSVFLRCVSEGPKSALKSFDHHILARRQVKEMVDHAMRVNKGRVFLVVVR